MSRILNSIHPKKNSNNSPSPFQHKERTTSLRVKISRYEEIRKIAFKRHTSMVNILDHFIIDGIKKYKAR